MIVLLGNVSIDRFLEIHIWLTTTIPTNDWAWCHESGYDADAVEFKNEEDAIAFKLKYPTV